MLIKIATHPYSHSSDTNNFMIIDRIECVDFSVQPRIFTNYDTTSEGLKNYLKECDRLCMVITLCPTFYGRFEPSLDSHSPVDYLNDTRVYRINQISFTRDNEYQTHVFDTIAYICNEEGKTLEKCFAGGILNK